MDYFQSKTIDIYIIMSGNLNFLLSKKNNLGGCNRGCFEPNELILVMNYCSFLEF